MRGFLLSVLAFASSGIAAPFQKVLATCANPDQVELYVSTTGGQVHGMVDLTTPDVRQFLGIPFAQPPVGDLRFAPPIPASPFGALEATALPPSCMQFLGTSASVYNRDVLQFGLQGINTTGTISEDCLSLSVWTPANATATSALPVLVFIYGGGFITGGQNVPYQLPPQWIQRTQNHIVVSFNYRLNIFGFPNAAGLPVTGQNLGLLDQRLAVEWVRDNIARFGGDPTRIGLWGQSAGAISVALYNFAWYADPIVNALLHDSGTEYTQFPGPVRTSNFTFVAEHVGCGGLDPAAELACVRGVDAYALEGFLAAYTDAGGSPALSFLPVADGNITFSNYTERAVNGQISKVPAIIGTNAQDGVPFAPYNPAGPNQTIVNEELLSTFFCPSFKTTMNRLLAGVPTYRYVYSGNFSNIAPRFWLGSFHSSELPLIFGTHPDYRGNSTALEYATSTAMQDAWLAIVRGGAAGMAAEGWPIYAGVADGQVRQFGNGVASGIGDTKALEAQCGSYLSTYA